MTGVADDTVMRVFAMPPTHCTATHVNNLSRHKHIINEKGSIMATNKRFQKRRTIWNYSCLFWAVLFLFCISTILSSCSKSPISNSSDLTYKELIYNNKQIRRDGNTFYFSGDHFSVFKYDSESGEIQDVCTDPLCSHYGKDSSCRIGQINTGSCFFAVNGNNFVYTVPLSASLDDSIMQLVLFRYDVSEMTNLRLDHKNGIDDRRYTISSNYCYYVTTYQSNKTGEYSFGMRQCNLETGKTVDFGEKTESVPRPLGAIGGKVFWKDAASSKTYVCNEDKTGSAHVFWDYPISFPWGNSNDIFFRSTDPDDPEDSLIFYIFHTDLNGKVISRFDAEDIKCMCVSDDGKYIYYISRTETPAVTGNGTPVKNNDGSDFLVHGRKLFRIDTETGETDCVFVFDGIFSALNIGVGDGSWFWFDGKKIYTNSLAGYIEEKPGDEPQRIGFSSGLIIIDTETGKVVRCSADFDRSTAGSRSYKSVETVIG